MTVIRLCIFYLLALLPCCIMAAVVRSSCGGPIFRKAGAATVTAVGITGMCMPSIAHFLTRLLTREGFQNLYLELRLKKNVKAYLASVLVVLAVMVLSMVVIRFVLTGDVSASQFWAQEEKDLRVMALLQQLAVSCFLNFPALGEEWGWRGYMMPKLEQVMSKPAAVIVGGILWGLWHAPLTVNGHNFGLDYPGFPYVGILVMCVFCILMNGFLTMLTEKTGTVYPAALAHATNNNLSVGVLLTLFASENAIGKIAEISNANMKMILACAVLYVPVFSGSMILLLKGKKR